MPPIVANEARLGQVFLDDPFFTTKPVGVGAGLGLWMGQEIVTSLGGPISAESEPGEGATFRVVLPSTTSPELEPAHAAATAAPAARPERLRLLVIDDEIAIGRTLAIALSDEFDVKTATSGREALQMLGGAQSFDVVLCDLMMPDVSGMDVYERIVAQRPQLASRFVFVTGGAFTDRARTFVDHVRAPVVEKPFELAKLPRLLRTTSVAAAGG